MCVCPKSYLAIYIYMCALAEVNKECANAESTDVQAEECPWVQCLGCVRHNSDGWTDGRVSKVRK